MKNVSCSCLQHCQSILETLMKPLPGLVPVMQTEHEMPLLHGKLKPILQITPDWVYQGIIFIHLSSIKTET